MNQKDNEPSIISFECSKFNQMIYKSFDPSTDWVPLIQSLKSGRYNQNIN